jgi:hypothetical protein
MKRSGWLAANAAELGFDTPRTAQMLIKKATKYEVNFAFDEPEALPCEVRLRAERKAGELRRKEAKAAGFNAKSPPPRGGMTPPTNAERKRVYEFLHPETKKGAGPGIRTPGSKGGKSAKFADQPASFTRDTAKKTGPRDGRQI